MSSGMYKSQHISGLCHQTGTEINMFDSGGALFMKAEEGGMKKTKRKKRRWANIKAN